MAAGTASPTGIPGMIACSVMPKVPPMKSIGKIVPPMNPVERLTANVSILATMTAISRPTPSAVPSLTTSSARPSRRRA